MLRTGLSFYKLSSLRHFGKANHESNSTQPRARSEAFAIAPVIHLFLLIFRRTKRIMAEAVEFSSPTKYFCHQCSREVSLVHPFLELTCPDCSSGFIEEVSRDLYEAQEDYISEEIDELNPIAESDFGLRSELLSLHNDLFGQALQNIGVDGDEDSDVSYIEPLYSDNDFENFLPYHGYGVGVTRDGFSYYTDYLLEDNIDTLVTQFLDEVEISGPPPLPKAQIKSLPTKVITKENVEKGVQCTVCMEDFVLREKVKCLPCQHFYHEKCITPWLERHATCPNCRETIKSQPTCRDRRSVSCPRSSTHSDEESQLGSQSSASSSSSVSSLSDFFSTSINPFRFLH